MKTNRFFLIRFIIFNTERDLIC